MTYADSPCTALRSVSGKQADRDVLIASTQLSIGHAQRDAQNVFDTEEDDGRPRRVPADDEEAADDLDPDLPAVVVDRAAARGQSERFRAVDGREQAILALLGATLLLDEIAQSSLEAGERMQRLLERRPNDDAARREHGARGGRQLLR